MKNSLLLVLAMSFVAASGTLACIDATWVNPGEAERHRARQALISIEASPMTEGEKKAARQALEAKYAGYMPRSDERPGVVMSVAGGGWQ